MSTRNAEIKEEVLKYAGRKGPEVFLQSATITNALINKCSLFSTGTSNIVGVALAFETMSRATFENMESCA